MKSLNKIFEATDKTKPHLIDSVEGKDDKNYFDLMAMYKEARHTNPSKAEQIMSQIDTLTDVSEEAQEAAMYL